MSAGATSEQARLMGSQDLESISPYSWADVKALPPLRAAKKRAAADANIFIALSLWLLAYTAGLVPSYTTDPIWRCALWSEAVVILTCFFGFLRREPSTVKRTPETCFPQPPAVAARLRDGIALEGMDNLHEDGRTFCVRCLVWRPESGRIHHCSTCERCSVDFDHHCFVYGRCVAGGWGRGNLGFFRGLCLFTGLGFVTLITASLMPKSKPMM